MAKLWPRRDVLVRTVAMPESSSAQGEKRPRSAVPSSFRDRPTRILSATLTLTLNPIDVIQPL
jgi:hypothetical protein